MKYETKLKKSLNLTVAALEKESRSAAKEYRKSLAKCARILKRQLALWEAGKIDARTAALANGLGRQMVQLQKLERLRKRLQA